MLLPGLWFDAVGNITSLLFSVPFIDFRDYVGFSTSSHFCIIVLFLKVVQSISQNYCINTHPFVSFAHLLTASRFVSQIQAQRMWEKGPSPSLAPQSGAVSPLTFAP